MRTPDEEIEFYQRFVVKFIGIGLLVVWIVTIILFILGLNQKDTYVWTDPIKVHCAEFAQAVEQEAGIPITWDINPEGRCRLHPNKTIWRHDG